MSRIPGLKNTPSRLAVLSVLEKENKPLSVLEIYEPIKDKADLATVYRNLEVFRENNLVDRVEFGEGKYLYEIRKEDHHHLICLNLYCGKVEDIEDKFMSEWEREIKETKGFLVKNHSVEFFGLCKDCQK